MGYPLSIIIYTHNEENNIKECIESAKLLTDNIIIIDSQSQDKTMVIADQLGCKSYSVAYSSYVEPVREIGIRKAMTDWVLIMDADEKITKELAAEIKLKINNQDIAYYKVPRKNIFARKYWLKHGWWPDYQIRLINTKHFVTWPKAIHSTPTINNNMGFLQEPLIHYFHGDFDKMVEKTINFENIEANLLFEAKRKAKTITFFRKFLGELYRRLIRDLGLLDGKIGIIESIYQAFSKTITYLYLYEKKKSSTI